MLDKALLGEWEGKSLDSGEQVTMRITQKAGGVMSILLPATKADEHDTTFDAHVTALGALKVKLTPAHLAELAKAFPPDVAAGSRYPESQLVHMDSEKTARAS